MEINQMNDLFQSNNIKKIYDDSSTGLVHILSSFWKDALTKTMKKTEIKARKSDYALA